MLTPWKESYYQPRHHIKKQRHYFANKGPSSQSYGFSSSHYGCESWTIKKAEHRRINAFELWYWRRLLRVPWTARRSNQSILKEISPECSLEGLMLNWNSNTLVTWWEELTHLKRPWCWERLEAGGEGGDRGWDGWMASLTQWRWVWLKFGSWWWTGRPGVLQSLGSRRVGHNWATEMNWSDSDSESWLVVQALFGQDGCQREGFWEVVGHVMSPFDLSWTLLLGGGLLGSCFSPGPAVIKQLMWMVPMVPGQGGWF